MKYLLYPFIYIIQSIFGVIDWEPPVWIRKIAAPIDRSGSYLLSTRKKRISIFLIVLLSAGGYLWYRSLPEPYYITYAVKEPAATPLTDNAKPYPLEIQFSGSASPIEGVGKEIIKGIQVTPELKGNWKWESDSLMKFFPETDWSVGIPYKVKFDKKVFARPVLLKEYSFSFTAPPIAASIQKGEFYEDPTDPKVKQVVYTVSFTHPVDKGDFEKRIALKMRVEPQKNFDSADVKSLPFKVVYNEKATEAYVRSQSIAVPERDGETLITLDKGIRAAKGGNGTFHVQTRTVQIPGIENYFKVLNVKSSVVTDEKTYEAKRILSLETTAAVNQKEIEKNIEIYLLSNDPKFTKQTEDEYSEEESSGEGDEGEGEEYGEGEEGEYMSETSNGPEHCPWKTPGEISEAHLKASTPIQVKLLPSDTEFSTLKTLSFDAEAGRCVFVRLKKGTKSFGDFQLATDKSFVVDTKPFPAEVKVMHQGALLTLTGDKKISIMTRSLEALRFKLNRVLPSSVHHLVTQSWGDMPNPNFYYNMGLENISEVFTSEQQLNFEGPGKPQYTTFSFENYLRSDPSVPKGLFVLEISGWDPVGKYEKGPREKRLILITDVGIIVKDNQDTSHDLYIQSLAEGSPLNGAQVSIVGKNGMPIFSETADAQGHVHFTTFRDFTKEKTPAMYVVEKGGDYSFLPYNKSERELNLSRFDIGGEYTNEDSSALLAYLFTDRGIYRPGEEAHIGLIVKRREWGKLPDGLPLTLRITDPRGSTMRETKIAMDSTGFAEFNLPFSEAVLTGTYNAQLSVYNKKRKYDVLLGSTTLRVEEFRPDSLQIQTQLVGKEEGVRFWRSPEGLQATVQLRNLFGTPAVEHTMKGTMYVSPFIGAIPGYGEYTFLQPEKRIESFNEPFGEEQTDEDGRVTFDLDLARYATQNLKVTFVAEGFEKGGGRSVSASQSIVVSKEPYLVGYKADDDLSFIHRGSKRIIKLVALTGDLKRSSAEDLTLELIEKQYVSVLQKQPNGNLAYQSVEKKSIKSTQSYSILADGTELAVSTDTPGNFIYELKNSKGEVISRMPFTVVGQANLARSLERSTELQIKLSKNDYAPGEDIELQIQAPFTGAGLITIEQNKIYAAKWFKTDSTNSVQKITVPSDLEGNGYVNVTFLRSVTSPEIFVSPLSYGVEPFTVNRAGRTQKITLNVPAKIKPGEKLTVNYKADRPTRMAIFAVDQGILQVAKYKTPDPLAHFFRKRALEVSTHQILDLLLPEYNLIAQLSGAGGDEEGLLGRFRNPFKRPGQKPVAYWSGIVNADQKEQSISFEIPDYFNGTIRTFAVSVDVNAIGVVEKETVAQGDIVLSPTVPFFTSPGDTFEVNTVVTNIASKKEDIEVQLLTDNYLSVEGDSKFLQKIPTGKDAVVRFKIKTLGDHLGSSKVIFAAKGSSEAKYSMDLSIRPAIARKVNVTYGIVKGSQPATIPLSREMYPELAEKKIGASTVPVSFVSGLAKYLDTYPFGCSEQLASKGFDDLIYLKDPRYGVKPDIAGKAIEKIALALGAHQRQDGSFAMWRGSTMVDPFLSVHIARFLIEAKERGAAISPQIITESVNYLRTLANGTPKDLQDARTRAYAIYLLTRKEEVTTSYIQALLAALKDIKGWEEDITALFIASSYKLLHLDSEGEALLKTVSLQLEPERVNEYHDQLAHKAHVLYLFSKHFPEALKKIPPEFIESIAQSLEKREYSTISSSLLLLGLEGYLSSVGGPHVDKIEVSASKDQKDFRLIPLHGDLIAEGQLELADKLLKVLSKDGSPLFYQVLQDGYDKQIPASASNGIEVFREYRDSKGSIIHEANVGEDVEIRIVVRSLHNQWLSNIAISDLLPSGFELVGGTDALKQTQIGAGDFVPFFVDATEDRALLFGSVGPTAQEFKYKVKAVTKGEFQVAPIQAESMYNQLIFGRGDGGKFVVN